MQSEILNFDSLKNYQYNIKTYNATLNQHFDSYNQKSEGILEIVSYFQKLIQIFRN